MKTILFATASMLSVCALAAPPATTSVSPDQRKQMAEMHAKAAECLNSNKTMEECRSEMMKSAPHMGRGMGSEWGCPMMGTAPQPETKTKTTK